MNYNTKKLYIGLVECYRNNAKALELHALYDDMNSEELMDLNIERPVLPYGEEEFYYKKTLIPFSEILMRSKINYGHVNREDAFKIMKYYDGYYFKLLRYKHIETLDDLKETVEKAKAKKR